MDAIDYYQYHGHFEEIIDLLAQALSVDRAYTAMSTELGELLTKYRSKKMIDNCKVCWQHCNTPGAGLRGCNGLSRNE